MAALGRHILADFYGCNPEILDSEEEVKNLLIGAAQASGATIVGASFHRFAPQGVSGMVLIAESHLAIHTWPENGFAAVDIFTCGPIEPLVAYRFLLEAFQAQSGSLVEVNRGIEGLV
jgi:spermidine synthase